MFRIHLAATAMLAGALVACRGELADVDPAPVVTPPTERGERAQTGPWRGNHDDSAGESPALENEASVVTWNLESYPLSPSAEDKAVALLTEMAADVVALQEIADEDAFYALLQRLPDYDGVLNDDPGAWLRVGLLWRRDRVQVDDVETLFSTDWYAFPRPPLAARITIDAPTPIDFVTVVLHLKAQLDAESEARRRTACERLDTWVSDQLGEGDERDYLLVGDFNDKLTDPPQWNVFGAFLDKPDAYRFLTQPAAEAGEHTYLPFESFIDHVLVTSDALDEIGSGSTEVLAIEQDISDYRDLTDHRPVRTWLRW